MSDSIAEEKTLDVSSTADTPATGDASSRQVRLNRLFGAAAMSLVVLIYAANFIVTRYSVRHGLSPFDLVALRFLVAGVILLPYFLQLGPKTAAGIGWPRAIWITVLAGAPYMWLFFCGLRLAPAAHGAVLNPGVVPSVVFIGLVFLGVQSFSAKRAVALALILVGVVLVTSTSLMTAPAVLLGDLLLLATGISWGCFTILAKRWRLRPLQATTAISVLSLICLPVYWIWGFEGFDDVSNLHVVGQALFQGIVNSILTLYLVTFAVQRLGAQLASLFNPLVPILTTLIAIPVLDELPAATQWLGIGLVIVGMVTAAMGQGKFTTEKQRT